jgi:hypothetical protein
MVVLSDFLIHEGYQEGLRLLAGPGGPRGGGAGAGAGGGGFDTYCLQILSPGEIDPATEGTNDADGSGEGGRGPIVIGDLKLTDVETSRTAEVTVTSALLKRYRATVAAYIDGLRSFCTARGMTAALVRSDAAIETLLMDYFRKRGLLR